MEQCNTLSFKNQIIYCGIDVHKNSWKVHLRHCNLDLAKISMHPDTEELSRILKKNYPDAEYKSVYEAGFSGFEAHRKLCALGRGKEPFLKRFFPLPKVPFIFWGQTPLPSKLGMKSLLALD